jgi:outer membrane protein TolC
MRTLCLGLGLLLALVPLYSQQAVEATISLPQAIDLAIAQNPQVRIQQIQTDMAKNNVFRANAGQGPRINAVGDLVYANNFANVDIRTFQPEPAPEKINIDESGVETFTTSLGVQADYLLYDGGMGKHRFSLLNELSKLAKAEQEVVLNEIILGVGTLYWELLNLQNTIDFLSENVEISRKRVEKMRDRKAFGKASQLAVLQAETNLNEDLRSLSEVQLAFENLRSDLNVLLDVSADTSYRVVEVFDLPEKDYDGDFLTQIKTQNPLMALAYNGQSIAKYQLKLAEAQRRPVLASFVQAGYFFQANDVQQLASIRTVGATVGLSASFNLYDGGVAKNKKQNAGMELEIALQKATQLEDQLFTTARKEQNNIERLRTQLDREISNLTTFEEVFNRTQEFFYAGKANALDLRSAQLAKLNGQLNIDRIRIQIMQAQMRLDHVLGRII